MGTLFASNDVQAWYSHRNFLQTSVYSYIHWNVWCVMSYLFTKIWWVWVCHSGTAGALKKKREDFNEVNLATSTMQLRTILLQFSLLHLFIAIPINFIWNFNFTCVFIWLSYYVPHTVTEEQRMKSLRTAETLQYWFVIIAREYLGLSQTVWHEKVARISVGKLRRKRLPGMTRHSSGNNIKIDLISLDDVMKI